MGAIKVQNKMRIREVKQPIKKHFELTDDTIEFNGKTLYRILATRDSLYKIRGGFSPKYFYWNELLRSD